MPELRRCRGGHGTDRRDDGRVQQIGRLFLADERGEARDRRGVRERHRVDLALEQQAIEILRGRGIGRRGGGAVGDEVGHDAAAAREVLADDVAQVIGPDHEDPAVGDRRLGFDRVADRLRAGLGGHDIRLDPARDQPFGRGRADRANRCGAERPQVARAARQRRQKPRHGVRRLEDHPLIVVDRRRGAVDGFRILRRREPERRRQDRLRAGVLEPLDELARLFLRSRHDDAPAEERPLVEPAQVFAQARDCADDEQGGVSRRRR